MPLPRTHLETAVAGLSVQDGDGAEVGVWRDAELPLLDGTGAVQGGIPVDVERVRRIRATVDEPAVRQPRSDGQKCQQFGRQLTHGNGIGVTQGL